MIKIDRNTDLRIKCYKCGNEHTMDMMRMDPKGKNLVCRTCLDRKPSHKIDAKSSESEKHEEPSIKEYFCKECRYSFKRANHLVISTCPYCGSSGSVTTKGSTARIMADVSKMK